MTEGSELEHVAAGDLLALPQGSSKRALVSSQYDEDVEIPCIVVRGASPGPRLLVMAGVHGGEYASIDAAYRIADRFAGASVGDDPASYLNGLLVVLPVVNPAAYFGRSVYVNPADGKNLNRVFPGKPAGSYSERLAHWLLEEFVKRSDALIDLHGGDLVEALEPFSIHVDRDERSAELARTFGLSYQVTGTGNGTTFAAASAAGVPAIIAEAGGRGQRNERDISLLVDGTQRVMKHLGMSEQAGPPAEAGRRVNMTWLTSDVGGGWMPEVKAGQAVAGGERLGTVLDMLGRPVQELRSPSEGEVLFIVSGRAIGSGDPLLGLGTEEQSEHAF